MKPNTKEPKMFEKLKNDMGKEVRENILPYWMKFATDTQNGGFIGRITNKQIIEPKSNKSGVLNTRLLWTYSSAYRVLGDQTYLDYAERAFRYLEDYFYDKKLGGCYWSVDYLGEPSDKKKHAYVQAFAIYGYSEYARATGSEKALNRAIEIFELLEKHAFDKVNGGYIEAFSRDWNELPDARLGDGDADERHSMNTQLHIMEAYTNLYKIWKDEHLKKKLQMIVNLILEKMYNSATGHFYTFFDEKWNHKSKVYSYGHDIEAAWLLNDAAEVLAADDLLKKVKKVAVDVAYTTLSEGVNKSTGGIFNTGENGKPADRDFHWWVQAEAIIGFLYACEITRNPDFIQASVDVWKYIVDNIIDHENGEWYFRVAENGVPYMYEDKLGPWKCPYHNSRACLIMIERFGSKFDDMELSEQENSQNR